MASFIKKYEVQKGRTVTCMMGIAHEGAKLESANFSGPDNAEKQEKIDTLVKIGVLKEVPLTDAEKEAILKAQEIIKAREKKRAEARANAEREAAEKLEAEAETKAKKEAAILEANFNSMNKGPMIEFAEEWEIALTGTTAEEIRTELIEVQEALTAPE